jgi:hypothetical protein
MKRFLCKFVYHAELCFMLPCADFPDTSKPGEHLVQFYRADECLLTRNVVDFLIRGLKQGDALLVITTPERNAAFSSGLRESGIDPDVAVLERKLLFADAEQTLRRFMRDGQPDWRRFERTIEALIGEVRLHAEHGGLRAYGEMVGLLWQRGEFQAAIRLEQFWNKLMGANALNLFCAYPIDLFGKDFQTETLHALLCEHTHLVPAGRNGDLSNAIQRSMDEVLGPNAKGLQARIEADHQPSWASMPEAETVILWLRNNLPEHADEILARARRYYRASHASGKVQ